MKIGYARVSVDSQDHALQLDALHAAGCEKVFIETASGSRTDRPELAKLLEMVRRDDVIAVYRLDRLGRSLKHLIEIAETLERQGVGFQSLTEQIDTTTPSGRFMFSILGALSSMEREVLIQRTKAGLAAAAARGRRGGRPPVLDEAKVRAAKAMLASGTMTTTEIARQLGCAPSTLYRHLPGGRGALDKEAA
ncbi:recombinase family protein [Pseudoroseomonas sp. WGS1072]|uniref:recombinase family protein n=1 Tax=Roseomonas sp. WGS1072 TaxID=3366816 RepID=UPI003BF0A63E